MRVEFVDPVWMGMTVNVSNSEPLAITAGNTLVWRRDIDGYTPGDGWALSYALVQRTTGFKILFTGAADASGFLVTVTAATTAAWLAGEYDGQGYVSKGAERYQVWRGSVVILPNFAGDMEVGDTRSKAKIILDFIDASFTKLAQKQTVSGTIEGVALTFRSMDELTKARNYWGGIYAQEQAALHGRTGRRRILARFVNAT